MTVINMKIHDCTWMFPSYVKIVIFCVTKLSWIVHNIYIMSSFLWQFYDML